tara:strand:+ start:358 stop:543 length:186 start_codon:yes stop_codon:yes gene_type:complete
MRSHNNNMSKNNIKDVYRLLISKAESRGEPSDILRNRLNVLISKDKKRRGNKAIRKVWYEE